MNDHNSILKHVNKHKLQPQYAWRNEHRSGNANDLAQQVAQAVESGKIGRFGRRLDFTTEETKEFSGDTKSRAARYATEQDRRDVSRRS
jgi:hypothetical protein